MSITYKIEICNEKIEEFSVFVEEIFKTVLECGKLIVKEQLENLDEKLMRDRDSKRYRNKGIGIAYDGVLYRSQKDGRIRRELNNKVAYANFDPAADFRKHKENVIASVYNTDEIELRIKNGDGANCIQKDNSCECICVLDKFYRNKKITECVSDKNIAENLRNLLFENRFNELLECIEAYINSSEDEREKVKLQELYRYYSENKEALAGYYDRGITIPSDMKWLKNISSCMPLTDLPFRFYAL